MELTIHHIFVSEICLNFASLHRCYLHSFHIAHFTFYSRFFCRWLKIMCSVSLRYITFFFSVFCYLLTFLSHRISFLLFPSHNHSCWNLFFFSNLNHPFYCLLLMQYYFYIKWDARQRFSLYISSTVFLNFFHSSRKKGKVNIWTEYSIIIHIHTETCAV